MKNIENVRSYQKDICEALGVEFKEEDMVYPFYFLNRFTPQQIDYLGSLGLINRGFCPDCGISPIGDEYHRDRIGSKTVQYLCKDCWETSNPFSRPKYKRRYYTIKFVMWAIGIGILIGTIILIRGCFRFLF